MSRLPLHTLVFLISCFLAAACSSPDPGDPCSDMDCSGHGTCYVEAGLPACDCLPGYRPQGLSCLPDDSPPCEGVDCSGHGDCLVEDGQPVCSCHAGYRPDGLQCLAVADPCEAVDCSGHGSCFADQGVAACDCEPGYVAQGLSCLPDGQRLAVGVNIHEVAAFQAVKVRLFGDGQLQADRSAPLVAGRQTLIRIYLEPDGAPDGTEVQALLALDDGTRMESGTVLNGPSSEADPDSSIQFMLPADRVQTSTRLSVRLVDPTQAPVADGQDHPARVPRAGGLLDLAAEECGGALELVIVPVRYDTDGSGRLPDLGEAALDDIAALLHAVYPLEQIQLTVHEALPWDHGLSLLTRNFKFGQLNEELVELKENDGAPSSTYYYGMVAPAETFADYCFYSCVTGQGWVVDDPADGSIRVGSGLGFAGERWIWTLLHELGHLHGLGHAPCGTAGEAGYPYGDGSIGSWGFDERTGAFLNPELTDFMGYCSERWISDYNYDRLLDRIQAVGALGRAPAPAPQTLRFLSLDADGHIRWGKAISMPPPTGQPKVEITFLASNGVPLAEGAAFWLAAGDGSQTLLIPKAPRGSAALRFTLPDGRHIGPLALP